jgi:hypothetical protein
VTSLDIQAYAILCETGIVHISDIGFWTQNLVSLSFDEENTNITNSLPFTC